MVRVVSFGTAEQQRPLNPLHMGHRLCRLFPERHLSAQRHEGCWVMQQMPRMWHGGQDSLVYQSTLPRMHCSRQFADDLLSKVLDRLVNLPFGGKDVEVHQADYRFPIFAQVANK